MATTYTLLNIDDNVSLDIVSLEGFNRSNIEAVDTKALPNGGRETIYQKVTGEDENPLTIRVGYYPQPATALLPARVNYSLKVMTSMRKTVDTVEAWVEDANVVIAFTLPVESGIPNVTDMITLLTASFLWALPIDTGALQEDGLNKLKFGVTTGLESFTDSASV